MRKAVIYKIEVYIPAASLDAVKQAMFDAGAGRIGNYDCCAWQVEGEGQFRPQHGSNPAIGAVGKIEKVKEFKVELVCESEYLEAVLGALRTAHPYEEPAYQYWQVNGN